MLKVITGPMFSGKSLELIRLGNCSKAAGKTIAFYKPSINTRDLGISSRDGLSTEAIILKEGFSAKDYVKVDVHCFDEANFFPRGTLDVDYALGAFRGVEVIVAGISRKSDQSGFGCMPALLAMADEIVQLKSVCHFCKRENSATRTIRFGGDLTPILVGSSMYGAVCPRCFYEKGFWKVAGSNQLK